MGANNGKFNLDYEESVLLRSRLGRLKRILTVIHAIATKLLKGRMSETDKDRVREIRSLSDKDDW